MKDDKFLKNLHHKLLPLLTSHVYRNGGNIEEAKDLLQDSLIVLFRSSKASDFQLTSSIETYVFGIAKRKWLAELRKKRNSETKLSGIEDELGNDLEEMIINNEKQDLYVQHFRELTDSCKKLLQLFFKGIKMKEIADQLGFSSEGYARKRKHNCQEKLIENIKQDPIFKELTNE
ncbi:RNA polymerase sigma factor [Ekhidna sp.]